MTVVITNYIKKYESRKLALKALIISVPCIIVMSIRYGIGTDYLNYFKIFLYPNQVGIGQYELLFSWLLNLTRQYVGNFQFFVFLTSALTVFLYFYWVLLYVNKEYWNISVFIVLCLYFGIWLAAIGQVIAIGFVLFAIKEIENKRPLRFLIFAIIAGLFHSSALIVIPCYFVISGKKNVNLSFQAQMLRMIIVIVICAVFTNLFFKYGNTFGIKYASYIDNYREGGRTTKFLLFSLTFYIPEVFLMNKTIKKYSESRLYYYLLIIEATTFIMSSTVAYAFRMGQYFSSAHAVLAPMTLSACSNNKRRAILLLYYICAFGFYFYYTTFALNYNGIVPYRTFMFLY